MGRADAKTELPPEYIELEQRVDALKLVLNKLLAVTSQYEHEGYDYPANLRESVGDLGKSISEKIRDLASSQTASEAQAAISKSSSRPAAPKTMAHALGRAAAFGAERLNSNSTDPYGSALAKYAVAEERIGNARLAQDSQISTRFNASVSTTLNTSISFASKARKAVSSARLSLDATKSSLKSARPEKQDALRLDVEQAEDAFIAAVEEATTVMKNVLDTGEPLIALADLIAAQLQYFKEAYEVLAEIAPQIDELQQQQELAYRKRDD